MLIHIDENDICNLIRSSCRMVKLSAPSVSCEVMDAILGFLRDGSNRYAEVTIDLSVETARSGYGKNECITDYIKDNPHLSISTLKGLRIGSLICDDKECVYVPDSAKVVVTPLSLNINAVKNFIVPQVLLEKENKTTAQPVSDTSAFNDYNDGHTKGGSNGMQSVEAEVSQTTSGAGSEKVLLTQEAILEYQEELAKAQVPDFEEEKKFYTVQNEISFVEVELPGINIKAHILKVPDEFLMLSDDKEVQKRFKASYKLVDEKSDIQQEMNEIQNQLNKVRKKYLLSIPNYGALILTAQQANFNGEIEKIEKEIKEKRKNLEDKLKAEIESSKSHIIDVFCPLVAANPSEQLCKYIEDNGEESHGLARLSLIKQYMLDSLNTKSPSPETLINDIQIRKCFKGLDIGTYKDEKFLQLFREKAKSQPLFKAFLDEKAGQQKIFPLD